MYGYGVCYECKEIKTTLHEYNNFGDYWVRQFCSEQCFEPYRLWITEGILTS
jgi:hypothetical protein